MPLPRLRSRRPGLAPALAAGAVRGVVVVSAPERQAWADEVSPTAKGTVGGGLLGAEVVTITEALAGVKPGWAYAGGAVVGGGAPRRRSRPHHRRACRGEAGLGVCRGRGGGRRRRRPRRPLHRERSNQR